MDIMYAHYECIYMHTDYQGVSMEALVNMANAYSKQCKEYFDDFDIMSIDLYISMCVFTYVHTYKIECIDNRNRSYRLYSNYL